VSLLRIAFLIAAVSVLLTVGAAQAGTYEVRACDFAPAATNNSWLAANDSPATLEQAQVCPSSGEQWNGLRSFDKLASPNTPAGREAANHFDAPGGTMIEGAVVSRWIGKHGTNSWVPFVRSDTTILETCTIPGGQLSCEVGMGGGSIQTYTGLASSRLSVGFRCGQIDPSTCSNGGTIHSAWAVLYGATVTVSDPTPPSLAVDAPTSPLLSGWVKGSQQLSLQANDGESGVREIQLTDGNQVRAAHSVAESLGGCGTPNSGIAYTYPRPCFDGRGVNGAQTLQVNTDAWPSGAYNAVVRALDAGGAATEVPVTVRIDHDPPTDIRFTGLPANLRVRAGRRISGIGASADDPHSGLALIELEWMDLGPHGAQSGWRPYRGGSRPLARRAHRYQFRARASDALGNNSGYEYSPGLLAVQGPAVSFQARLTGGFLAYTARAPRGQTVRLGLTLRARGRGAVLRKRVRVRGRVSTRLGLAPGLRNARAATLVVRYRSGGQLRTRRIRLTGRGSRLRLPL
jgi:hypothetical protein